MLTEAEANALKRRHAVTLLKTPGVAGVGVEKAAGGYAVTVYLASDDSDTRARLPADLEGHPFRTATTGPFAKQ